MFAFRDSIPRADAGGSRPLLLADVGYPTHPSLHDIDGLDERYTHFDADAGYASPEHAQQVFAENLFGALEGRTDFAGLYWWSMLDLPGARAGGPCDQYLGAETGLLFDAGLAFHCSSGLIPTIGAPLRPAGETFRNWAGTFPR